MLAADVLCMAEASVTTLVTGRITCGQKEAVACSSCFQPMQGRQVFLEYLHSWNLPVAKSVWYKVLLILLTCSGSVRPSGVLSLCLQGRVAPLIVREPWEQQAYRESCAT